MVDLKKEIKLSDLFKRRAKPEPEPDRPAEKPEGRRSSFLKKEISFGRGRKQAPTAVAGEAVGAGDGPRASGRKRRSAAKGAPAVPAIPLMRAFNLMPKDDVRQAAGTRRPSTAQLVLAVVALVAIAALGSIFLIMNARVADKQKRYDDLRQQVAARKLPVKEPQPQGNPELVKEREERTSALASALGTRIAWDRLLREFSLVLPNDVWLTQITAKGPTPVDAAAAAGTPNPTSAFDIKGYTREQEGVARLLARMAVIPELMSVRLVSSARTDKEGTEVVEFQITAAVKTVTVPGGTA